MLSHLVSSESWGCSPIRNFSFAGGCADFLLTGRATTKKVRYDALASSQREHMNFAISRERSMWNEVVVSKFSSKTQLDDIMKRTPSQKLLTTRWVLTEKVKQENEDYKAKLIVHKKNNNYILFFSSGKFEFVRKKVIPRDDAHVRTSCF